jgi:hypothetical protein
MGVEGRPFFPEEFFLGRALLFAFTFFFLAGWAVLVLDTSVIVEVVAGSVLVGGLCNTS